MLPCSVHRVSVLPTMRFCKRRTVQFDANRHRIPCHRASARVTVKAYVDRVRAVFDEVVIAHPKNRKKGANGLWNPLIAR